MLDPWIIEEIRRREEEQREQQRSRLEIQIETPSEPDRGGRGEGRRPDPGSDRPGSSERGVVIIDFSI